MIRKFEVGMKLALTMGNVTAHVEVKNVPEDVNEKITIAFCKSGKEKMISREALKTAVRVKEKKERAKSALAVAIEVLEKAEKPMRVTEIAKAVLENGYQLPRKGKTFANTMSSRLNSAAEEGKIKKLANGVFSALSFEGEYVKELSKAEKARVEKAESKKAVSDELTALLADEE